MDGTIIPKDFDWEFYLEHYEDLRNAGLKTKEDAERHYLNYGQDENRLYKDNYKDIKKYFNYKDSVDKILTHKEFLTTKNFEKVAFTICATNFFSYALTLAYSLYKTNPNYRFFIFIIDEIPKYIEDNNFGFEVISIKNLHIPNLSYIIKEYNILEFATSVKPFCFNYIFKKFNFDTVIYFDPDILLYDKLEELEKELTKNDIVLTPHFFSPPKDNKLPNELSILNSGVYNLGFLALKRSENTSNFLNWWSNRLLEYCRIDFSNGMFVDQLWINLVPIYFNKVGIIENKGYNMAYWNIHERKITKSKSGYLVNNKEKLIFFHFSGYKLNHNISIHSDRADFKNRPDLLNIFLDYNKLVRDNKFHFFNKFEYRPLKVGNDSGINLYGFINGDFGIAESSKIIKKVLDYSDIRHNIIELISDSHSYTKEYQSTKENNFDINIISCNPDSSLDLIEKKFLHNKYNIGVWYWELDTLPNSWIENSKYFSELWAPSEFIYTTLESSLVSEIKIKRINLPAKIPLKLNKNECKEFLGYNTDTFICLFVFDFYSDIERKNPFSVIETFKRTFINNENSLLIIKTQNGNDSNLNKIKNYINGDKRIIHINDYYSREYLNILMNSCDVYISLHRSEGLGLTLQEAILLEKPTLCTNYSGNIDFCLPEWSELVNYTLVSISKDSMYNTINEGNSNLWAEPSINDASNKLSKIYKNLTYYEKRAIKGKQWIIENYNYDKFSTQIKDMLKIKE